MKWIERCLLALTPLWASACAEDVLAIALPDRVAPQSALMLAIEAEGEARMIALSPSDQLSVEVPRDARLTLLEYAQPWAELPFEPGELISRELGCALVDALPPDRSFVRTVAQAGPRDAEWIDTTVDQLSDFVRFSRSPAWGRCS